MSKLFSKIFEPFVALSLVPLKKIGHYAKDQYNGGKESWDQGHYIEATGAYAKAGISGLGGFCLGVPALVVSAVGGVVVGIVVTNGVYIAVGTRVILGSPCLAYKVMTKDLESEISTTEQPVYENLETLCVNPDNVGLSGNNPDLVSSPS